MTGSELDSFIFKFKQLWYSGLDAHLDVDTHAGQAWVGLRVGLGHAPGSLLHHQPPQDISHTAKKESPSRQRRRARRAAFRKLQAEKAPNESEIVAEDATSNPVDKLPENLDVENVQVDDAHSNVEEALNRVLSDEFCPDEDFNEMESVGETPFRCHLCRILFLPKNYSEGNRIANFESCQRHIGVLKCKMCAFVLGGLTKIGCHRQVCHHSA